MPEGAIYVGRPTVWGNPYRGEDAVEDYRWWLGNHLDRLDLGEIRGRDLACWCPLNQPCHADVLLELANR